MKRIFLTSLMFASLLSPSVTFAQTPTNVLVTAKELRARSQPYTSSPAIVSIYMGENVSVVETVTGQMVEGNPIWYKTKSGYYVWSGGTTGGVSLPTQTPQTTASVNTTSNTTNTGASSPWLASGSNIYYNSGNVGVGKVPGYKLDVSGPVNASQFCINGSNCITSWPSNGGESSTAQSSSGPWSTNGSNIYYNNGNLGLGTTNPAEKIDITGNIYMHNSDKTRELVLMARDADSGISGTHLYSTSNFHIKLYDGSNNHYTSFTNNGNVGIGIINPTQKLDVYGSVQATGYYSNGQQGLTRTINLNPSSPCSVTITGGIITSTTCQ